MANFRQSQFSYRIKWHTLTALIANFVTPTEVVDQTEKFSEIRFNILWKLKRIWWIDEFVIQFCIVWAVAAGCYCSLVILALFLSDFIFCESRNGDKFDSASHSHCLFFLEQEEEKWKKNDKKIKIATQCKRSFLIKPKTMAHINKKPAKCQAHTFLGALLVLQT